jgi:hypothetical protein
MCLSSWPPLYPGLYAVDTSPRRQYPSVRAPSVSQRVIDIACGTGISSPCSSPVPPAKVEPSSASRSSAFVRTDRAVCARVFRKFGARPIASVSTDSSATTAHPADEPSSQTAHSGGALYDTPSPSEHYDSSRTSLFRETPAVEETAGSKRVALNARYTSGSYPGGARGRTRLRRGGQPTRQVGPGFNGRFYYLAQGHQSIVELTPVPAPQQR